MNNKKRQENSDERRRQEPLRLSQFPHRLRRSPFVHKKEAVLPKMTFRDLATRSENKPLKCPLQRRWTAEEWKRRMSKDAFGRNLAVVERIKNQVYPGAISKNGAFVLKPKRLGLSRIRSVG